ncbi:MAG: hypothetical protein ABIM50_04445 [Novosphingobium sp.]
MENEEEVKWALVDEAMARQIQSQGEIFLQAQLHCAIASDSRATTMAGLFITLALAALGGGLGYWHETSSLSPLLSGLMSGALLTAAAALAAWSARPINFFFPGNQPKNWFAGRRDALPIMIGGEAENYQRHIDANDRTLGENQTALRCAYWLAIAAPLAGAVAWLIPAICSSFRG